VAGLRLFHPLAARDEGARRIGAEQFMRFGLVGGDRHRGKVGIFEAFRIVL
jgi:hypothetical protein